MDTTEPMQGTSFQEEEMETCGARTSGDDSLQDVVQKAQYYKGLTQHYVGDIRKQWTYVKYTVNQFGKWSLDIFEKLEILKLLPSFLCAWAFSVRRLFERLEEKHATDILTMIDLKETHYKIKEILYEMKHRGRKAWDNWFYNDERYQALKRLIQRTEENPRLVDEIPDTKEYEAEVRFLQRQMWKPSYGEEYEDEPSHNEEDDKGPSHSLDHEDDSDYSEMQEEEASRSAEPSQEEAEARDQNLVARQGPAERSVPTEDLGQQSQDMGEQAEESTQTSDSDEIEAGDGNTIVTGGRLGKKSEGEWDHIYRARQELEAREKEREAARQKDGEPATAG